MKTVNVDFTKNNIGTIAREGELNRTQIVFTLDEDLQMCDFINVKFGINDNLEEDDESPTLEYLQPDEGGTTLTIKLNQDMTVRGLLYMQLVGYAVDSETSEPHMIVKSPVVSGTITPSLKDKGKVSDGKPSLLDRILAKVHTLLEKAHVHSNAKTLAQFSNMLVEAGGAEGPVIMPDVVGIDRLKFWNSYIRYCSDGAVIMHTQEVEKDGAKFLRLLLSRDEFFLAGNSGLPDYIDIPVSEIKKVTEQSDPGLTLNGTELNFSIASDDTETIPVVSVLPETAVEGDVVLYKPAANAVSANDGKKIVILKWDWVNNVTLTDDTYFVYSNKAEEAAQIFDYTIYNESVPHIAITISTDARLEEMTVNQYDIRFKESDGQWVLDTEQSVLRKEKYVGNEQPESEELTLTELPASVVILDEINSVEYSENFSEITKSLFYIKPVLMIYQNGRWEKLITVPTKTSELEADAFYDRIENPNTTTLLPNKEYVFGLSETLTIDFAEGIADKRNEYLFSFISGETATVLTLPSSVKWVNELPVEANKRYEISVVDNVALWCAVDYTAEVTE